MSVSAMEELCKQVNFIVSGGALNLLTDFLGSKNLPALVLEPQDGNLQTLNVLDAVLDAAPDSLVFHDDGTLRLDSRFSNHLPVSAFEVEKAEGSEKWPCIVRMRGAHWELYLLLGREPEPSFVSELQPYAGLVNLWRTFQRIDDTDKQLSRLSYMLLATKNTLASIFEPMPLQYFAALLMDVLHESLFPKSIVVLKDEGNYLTVLNGTPDSIPARTGIYAEPILPPYPVAIASEAGDEGDKKSKNKTEIVLPIAEGNCRLFCLMRWDYQPDEQMMNFLELLGSLAVRALAINNLRRQAASYVPAGEFTVLSLSNVLKILKGARGRSQFLSLLADIFMEQCRMPDCLLAIWDSSRQGYILAEKRVGQFRADVNPTLLPSLRPVPAERVQETSYKLGEQGPDAILKSWGLGGCPWEDMASMQYLFPLCDDNALVGMIALASDNRVSMDKAQLASLHLIAQFAAYEFRRF